MRHLRQTVAIVLASIAGMATVLLFLTAGALLLIPVRETRAE